MITQTRFFCVAVSFITCLSYGQQEGIQLYQELDEVVITDSKFELKREHSGKVITKFTQNDLNNLPGQSIAEVLNMVSGIEINGARSNAGQNLSYFVRGGRNRQVLVLIDGIAVSDPSQIANDYDLRLIAAEQVESIEILKGAASTLYGTGAATAVINITLKRASKSTIQGSFKSVLGSNQSSEDNNYSIENFVNSLSVNGTVSKFNYMASIGQQYTNGLSAVSNGTEADAFKSINGNFKLGYKISSTINLSAFASFDKYDADFDNFDYTDADHVSMTDQYRLAISSDLDYDNGSILLTAAYNNIDRNIHSSFPSKFNAESVFVDAFNRYNFNNHFYTILGLNIQDNAMESFTIPFGETELAQTIDPESASFSIIDPYINMVYISKIGLTINSGLRLNNHSNYGSHLVYSVNPSFSQNTAFGYIKGIAGYSTSFITPSLFQLYEPSFGNTELKPEENATFELGTELGFGKQARISVVHFNRKETNFIDFIAVDPDNFIFQYNNVNENFTASGIEIEASFSISNKLNVNVNGTYTNVEDNLNLRIPEFKANAKLDYNISDKTFMSLAYQYNADREDAYFNNNTFETESLTLASYNLLDLYVNQKVVKDKLSVFGNVTNILNESYQELYGFTTKGRNVNIGVKMNF